MDENPYKAPQEQRGAGAPARRRPLHFLVAQLLAITAATLAVWYWTPLGTWPAVLVFGLTTTMFVVRWLDRRWGLAVTVAILAGLVAWILFDIYR